MRSKQWTQQEFDDLVVAKQFSTPAQEAAVDALVKHGSIIEAAEACGVTPSRLRGHLSELKRRAARRGWSPGSHLDNPVPEPFLVKGYSTYYGFIRDGKGNPILDENGQPKLHRKGQWVKTKIEEEHKLQLLLDAVQTIAEPFRGKSDLVLSPTNTTSDLMTVYPMGDPHFGMYSWHEEVGEDFDLEIAEGSLVAAVDHLVNLAPPSDVGLLINLGDFFHTDTMKNQTARSGNVLDVDTRWLKMLTVGIRAMRRLIDRALEKHRTVKVINAVGNHDEHTSQMLSVCLSMFYENNPRVEVDVTANPFKYLQFGENLIGVMHGDTTKPAQLPGLMATDQKEAWGSTSHRFWYTGHIHHDTVKEYPGPVMVETFRTLATKDAWHNREGYRSGRDMKCDILHVKHGRINRHIVGIEQLVWR